MLEFMHHQSWDQTLFLHYEADVDKLQALLPDGLMVDTYQNKAYIGVVALTETGIVGAFFPNWLKRLLRLSHDAVNVRTYVKPSNGAGQPGIFFFRLDCTSVLASMGARCIFAIPYCLSWMRRSFPDKKRFAFYNKGMLSSGPRLDVEWTVDETSHAIVPAKPDSLGHFLVERYCLYNRPGWFLRLLGVSRLWRGRIVHEPWPLCSARVQIHLNKAIQAVPSLDETVVCSAPVAHYSPGVHDIHFYFEKLSDEGKKA